jgi:hypothetical protein
MLSDTFVDERLARTDSDALRVLLVLHRMTTQKRPRTISYEEIGKRAGIDAQLVKGAFSRLAFSGEITFEKNMLTLDHNGLVMELKVTPTIKETEDDIVRENVELRRRIEEVTSQEASGLAENFSDEVARVIRTAESIMGRGLFAQEIFYLSELIARFGPKRVVGSLQATKNSKEPLRSTYVRMKRGASGKEMRQNGVAVPEVKYFDVPDTFDPFAKKDGK